MCWISIVVGTTSIVTGSRSSVDVWNFLRLVTQLEVGDVGDRPDRFVDPVHVHPGTGAYRVGRAGVDSVEQRGVGPVELDQRPRERAVQWLALERLGLPGPGHHGSDAAHRYDFGQFLIGDWVVLGGRHVHPTVRTAHADNAALAQGSEELGQEWSD